MEEVLKQIVEADKEARLRIEAKKQKRNSLYKCVLDEKAKMMDESLASMNERLALLQAKLDEEYASQQLALEKQVQVKCIDLKVKFEDNKEEWVQLVTSHCL